MASREFCDVTDNCAIEKERADEDARANDLQSEQLAKRLAERQTEKHTEELAAAALKQKHFQRAFW